LEAAARIFELLEPDNELVTLVDVTPVNRTRNFHNDDWWDNLLKMLS